MAGRPKKPAALKKLEGTYRKDRDGESAVIEQKMAAILPVGRLKVSKEITDPVVKKAYRQHIEMLNALGGSAVQNADNPLLEYAYKCLQLSKENASALSELDILDDEYDRVMKRYIKYFQEYERITKEFYLSPSARAKLKLDSLIATEKEQNIEKNKSVIASLLEKKQS